MKKRPDEKRQDRVLGQSDARDQAAASSVRLDDDGRTRAARRPPRAPTRRARAAPVENAIERVGARSTKRRPNEMSSVPGSEEAARASEASRGRSAKAGRTYDPYTVPEEVSRRFVNVGKTFYFPDGAPAFTDHGRKLSTPSENTEVIRSLVSIAESRGWKTIRVSGTEAFRREAWFAAGKVGLAVRGYVPSEFEQAQLARKLGGDAPSKADRSAPVGRRGKGRERQASQSEPREGIRGELLGHGRAPYRHREGEPMSYFIKLKDANGVREVWGVDLERALTHSLSQPRTGDQIALLKNRREPVTVRRPERDEHGKVIGERAREAHRNHWTVEKQSFLEERARVASVVRDAAVHARQAIAMHPELAGTYMSLRAAELASKRLSDREDRVRFVEAVRQSLADSVERGEPLAPVRLKERPARSSAMRAQRTREPVRELG